MSNGIVLTKTRALAMQTEKVLTAEGYLVAIVPTPRQFTGDCGIAVRFPWSFHAAIKAVLENAGVEFQGIQELKSETN